MANPRTTLPIGSTLGAYRLVNVLGNGAMGSVFEAQGPDGVNVAVKALQSTKGQRDAAERRARFLREAAVCASLKSPHIMPVIDHGIDAATDVPFLVMPLGSGEDLGTAIERLGAIEPHVAVALFVQACEGLAVAHGMGVVHRDIKPSNLFLENTPEGLTLRVADFGLAKVFDELTALTTSGAFMGTAQYVSPEQATNAKRADERSDVWSLGMSLYHALAGKPAFAQTGSFLALVLELTGGNVRPLQDVAPWVPAEVARVVHGTLIRDPTARCPSVREMALALEMAVGVDAARRKLDAPLSRVTRGNVSPRAELPSTWDDLLRV